MRTPHVSVVIPTYNGTQYLLFAITSVIQQTYTNIEIIIIDDGSTDNPYEVVKPYQSNHSIHYFRQKNQGPAAARNLGVAKATGSYVAFLDADDLWDKRKLELQVAAIKDSNADIVLSSLIRFEGSPVESNCYGLTEPPPYNTAVAYVESIVTIEDRIMANFCTALLPRKALLDVGCYDTSLTTAEDWDLWLRLAATLKYRFCNILQPLVYYRKHPTSLTRTYHFAKTFQNQLFVLDKLQKSSTAINRVVACSRLKKHVFFFETALNHKCFVEALKIWLSALTLPLFYSSKLVINLLKWPVRVLVASLLKK